MSTIAEIAQTLRVSSASVSRALNGRPGVSADLRSRILAEATRRNFVPHSNARALATTLTETVCFAVYNEPGTLAGDQFYGQIMAGVEQELRAHDYHLLVTTLDDVQLAHPEQWSPIQGRRVDGVILAGPCIPTRFSLAVYLQGMPVVLVDNFIAQVPIDVVLGDDRAGARLVAEHLLEHGHRRIVILAGPAKWYTNSERCAGILETLQARGLEPLALLSAATTSYDMGYSLMQQALRYKPTAVLAINDLMALGAIDAACAAGINVPQQLAVTGFDDQAAEHTRVPLTTLHLPKQELGRIAVRQLLHRIAAPESPQQRVLTGTALVIRQSCGCAPQPQ